MSVAVAVARVATTLGVVLFWVGSVVGGALAPGYSARDDVVSSLAGRGSSVAVLGIASILSLALAHAAAGEGFRQARRTASEPALLLGAAAATAVVAAFRVSLGGPDDTIDLVHAAGVVAYELFLVAAMVVVAARSLGRRRWLSAISVAAAVCSVALLLRWTGSDAGLWQRLWLGTNLGWLLLVTWTPRPTEEEHGARPDGYRGSREADS